MEKLGAEEKEEIRQALIRWGLTIPYEVEKEKPQSN